MVEKAKKPLEYTIRESFFYYILDPKQRNNILKETLNRTNGLLTFLLYSEILDVLTLLKGDQTDKRYEKAVFYFNERLQNLTPKNNVNYRLNAINLFSSEDKIRAYLKYLLDNTHPSLKSLREIYLNH